MTVEKHTINGSWIISEVIDSHLVTKRYFGYTKKEAIALFKADTRKKA